MASVNYPIGMNLGGDPSQALVHSNPDGKFTVALSAIDLGQGMKQVSRQIAAETLGVPIEDVYVDTADSDTGPHDMGSFASRGTHRMGNAIIVAAREARGVLLEAAAEELEVDAADLVTDPRVIVYRLSGAFFFGTASTVGAVLDNIADQHKAFVIDFSAVPFVDSTAANVIAGAGRKAARHGVRVYVTGATPTVRHALLRAGAGRPQVRYLPSIDDAVREAHLL